MAYTPTTDFLALLRTTGGGERSERMPGLDWFVAALARAGFFTLVVGQTAPTSNQALTAWFKPAVPSWSTEGVLFLWNSITVEYEVATPALWISFLAVVSSPYNFQSVTGVSGVIAAGTSLCAVQRVAPAITTLFLPTVSAQSRKPLQIVDYSTAVVGHDITLTPSGTDKIMQKTQWDLFSTDVQLAGLTLYPSTDLGAWVITP